jgi:hypothetical protein
MAIPSGAISNTVVSLAKAGVQPTASNVVGVVTDAVTVANNPRANQVVQGAAPLVTSAIRTLGSGAPFDPINGINQAVRLATGFMDPKTAAIAQSVSSGINALFGANGVFNPMRASGPPGNKPIALHTETLAAQDMSSAYGEGRDVVFSFVRANAALEGAISGSSDPVANLLANTDGEGNYLGTPPAPGSSLDLINKYTSPPPLTSYVSSALPSDLDRYSPL